MLTDRISDQGDIRKQGRTPRKDTELYIWIQLAVIKGWVEEEYKYGAT
jgi:hypothetical protein